MGPGGGHAAGHWLHTDLGFPPPRPLFWPRGPHNADPASPLGTTPAGSSGDGDTEQTVLQQGTWQRSVVPHVTGVLSEDDTAWPLARRSGPSTLRFLSRRHRPDAPLQSRESGAGGADPAPHTPQERERPMVPSNV